MTAAPLVPPGFIAGSGLKQIVTWSEENVTAGSSRLHRRERIETFFCAGPTLPNLFLPASSPGAD